MITEPDIGTLKKVLDVLEFYEEEEHLADELRELIKSLIKRKTARDAYD